MIGAGWKEDMGSSPTPQWILDEESLRINEFVPAKGSPLSDVTKLTTTEFRDKFVKARLCDALNLEDQR